MPYLWNNPPTPWLDENGAPLTGGQAFFFDAGTTTPLITYTTASLDIPNDHPVVANAAGRFPPIFMADGTNFRLRVQDADDTTLVDIDNISAPVTEPPEVPSGDTPVEQLLRTGQLTAHYRTGTLSGHVRANGRTIGDGSSGATERANADCQNLFVHLWTQDANLTVSGGRGANAAADWAASKTIVLPDFRGVPVVGLDGMGNSRANKIADSLVDGGQTADTLGATAGADDVTLTISHMPAHDHGSVVSTDPGHVHRAADAVLAGGPSGGGLRAYTGIGTTAYTESGGSHNHSIPSQGGGTAHTNLQPSKFATIYIKL